MLEKSSRKYKIFSTINLRGLIKAACIIIAILLYIPSLEGAFVFDDYNIIVFNENIQNINNLNGLMLLRPARFITGLSFALNYHFFGLNPFFYKLINLAIHLATSIVIYKLLVIFLGASALFRRKKKNHYWAEAGMLLFLVHPLMTSAVSYISQRYTLLSAFFTLSSILFFIKIHDSGEKRKAVYYYLLSLSLAFFAYLSKENSYILPFLAVLTLWHFSAGKKYRAVNNFFKVVPFFLISLVVVLFSFFRVSGSTNIKSGISNALKTTAANESHNSRAEYLLTQPGVVMRYAYLFLSPFNLNSDYDWQPVSSVFSIFFVLPLIFHLSFIASAIILFRKTGDKLPLTGVLFFYSSLFIESSFIPIADYIQEYRVYLPFFGLIIFSFSLIKYLTARKPFGLIKRKIFEFGAVFLFIMFCYLTYSRNLVWISGESFWLDAYSKSPGKPRVLYNLGVIKYYKGDIESARNLFLLSLEKNENYYSPLINLGFIAQKERDYEKAVIYYGKAFRANPKSLESVKYLASLLILQNRKDEAIGIYREYITGDPDDWEARLRVGILLFENSRQDEAREFLIESVKNNPEELLSSYYLALSYIKSGDLDKPLPILESLLKSGFRKETIYTLLSEIYNVKGDRGKADYYKDMLNFQ